MRGPVAEQRLQLRQGVARAAARDHFDPAVRQVPRVAAQSERAGMPGHEPAEPDALHQSGDEEPRGHAGRLRRALIASIAMGMTESAMIARITRLKFSFTVGMLPKK